MKRAVFTGSEPMQNPVKNPVSFYPVKKPVKDPVKNLLKTCELSQCFSQHVHVLFNSFTPKPCYRKIVSCFFVDFFPLLRLNV